MDRVLEARVAGQFGLVTRTQALAAGLSDKAIRWRVTSRRWLPVHPGVYQTQPGRDDWTVRAMAALLHVGSPAGLRGRSAAHAWGLLPEPTGPMEVLIPSNRRGGARDGIVVVRSNAGIGHLHETAWPHRTTVPHTVLDLAKGDSVDRAIGWMATACQKRLTTPAELREALAQRPNQTHARLLREVLEDLSDGLESIAEVRYVRDVEVAHGLPTGRRQASLSDRRRADNAYDEVRVIVEVDGRLGHDGWRARQAEGRRDLSAAGDGWLTVRTHWADVTAGACRLAAELGAVFTTRGWSGRARACRRPTCHLRARA